MRYNIAYKVLYKGSKGRLLSTNAYKDDSSRPLPDCVKLEYKIGETTEPVFGKIFVFPDLISAIHWKKVLGLYTAIIVKGIAINPTESKFDFILGVNRFNDCNNVEKFWNGNIDMDSLNKTVGEKWEVPASTFLCDKFKPIEVV